MAGIPSLLRSALLTLCLLAPLAAQGEEAVDLSTLRLSDQVLRQAESGDGRLLQQLLSQAFAVSPDGVVTREALDFATARETARTVSQMAARYLAFDLDLDGTVTDGELDRLLPSLDAPARLQAEMLRQTGDRDGDGRHGYDEIVAMVQEEMRGRNDARRFQFPFADDLLAMDLDSDGATAPEEIARVVAALRAAPRDPAGPVFRQAGIAPDRSCAPPKPGADAEIVIVSGYGGAALSNVAVAGRDVEATAARLVIEPGERPLYLVVTAFQAMVWQIEGDVDRVERIVVQPRGVATGPGAGVTGLPAEKVSFVPAGACFQPFHEAANGIKANWLKRAMAAALGRPADRVVASYTLNFTALPSGRDVTPPPAPRPVQKDAQGRPVFTVDMLSPENLMRRFHPGGLSRVDPAAVVAAGPVAAYEVLPQEAGLGQLLQEGALVPVEGGVGRRRGQAFLIRRPIAHFPAGLTGAHGVTFVLGKGVPMPEGDPGHSLVLDEETGRCLSRSPTLCRGFE